jgi:hypothetical protein
MTQFRKTTKFKERDLVWLRVPQCEETIPWRAFDSFEEYLMQFGVPDCTVLQVYANDKYVILVDGQHRRVKATDLMLMEEWWAEAHAKVEREAQLRADAEAFEAEREDELPADRERARAVVKAKQ